ncbi:helicase associated domain-containing protein [Streptomyces mirabilis]|uniref:helicase associated domain-containing protein n=1 Tax=Streptomyces mirabilis TaxID=68239 RepID=UPI00339FBEAE
MPHRNRTDPHPRSPEANPKRSVTALDAFAAREGHARVPHDRIEDGYPLGVKVASIRGKYRRGTLPAERVSTLEEIPGWTWFPKS